MGLKTFLILVLSSFILQDAWAGPVYFLDDLKTAVIGKSKEEVQSLLGKPNKYNPAQDDETGSWEYGYTDLFTWGMNWRVVEESTGIPCWTVDIDFANGRAESVSVSNCKY